MCTLHVVVHVGLDPYTWYWYYTHWYYYVYYYDWIPPPTPILHPTAPTHFPAMPAEVTSVPPQETKDNAVNATANVLNTFFIIIKF